MNTNNEDAYVCEEHFPEFGCASSGPQNFLCPTCKLDCSCGESDKGNDEDEDEDDAD